MGLYKRGRIWWVRFTTPNGKAFRRSSRTRDRRSALELHDRWRDAAWRIDLLGEFADHRWEEATRRWLTETCDNLSSDTDRSRLRWLAPHLDGRPIHTISKELIAALGERKKGERSAATANRYLALIRAILRRAALDWGWLATPPRIRLYPEPAGRVRWLDRETADRLIDLLPPHLADMVAFSLATGLRQANVLGLRWSHVDIERRAAWVVAHQAKGRRGIAVPLNDDALRVIARNLGRHPEFVFTFRGRQVLHANTLAFRTALRRAGITDFRWHDLRHTWASWHVQAGTPLHALQVLGGWRSAAMVQRYAHLGPGHLAEYASRIESAHGFGTAPRTGKPEGRSGP